MIDLSLVDSDKFLEMPATAQNLYFHLCVRTDDYGFVNAPRKVQRMVCASDDDLKLLIAKEYVIPFESGVIVVTDWNIHNSGFRKDRRKAPSFLNEYSQLILEENGSYKKRLTNDGQTADKCLTNGSVKESKVKESKVKEVKRSEVKQTPALTPALSDAEYERKFFEFYDAYPNHEFKEKTMSFWMKQRYTPEVIDLIMSGVEDYKIKIQEKNLEAKPPLYFLQDETWKDRLVEQSKKERRRQEALKAQAEQIEYLRSQGVDVDKVNQEPESNHEYYDITENDIKF